MTAAGLTAVRENSQQASQSASLPAANNQRNFHHTYYKAIEDLKVNLLSLANPLLAPAIFKALLTVSQKSLDPLKGIQGHFAGMILPEQTVKALDELNCQILHEAKEHADDLISFVKEVKNDLHQLAMTKREDVRTLWPAETDFFNLPPLRKVDNEAIKLFLYAINKGDFYHLKDLVGIWLKDHVASLNNELEQTKYGNLDTLLSQVADESLKKEECFLGFWNSPATFFREKTLYFTFPRNHQTENGIIEECIEQNGGKTFRLKEFELHISNAFQVTITKKKPHKLWHGIHNHSLCDQEFEIVIPNDKENGDILQGVYQHGKIKEIKGFFGSSFTREVELTETKKGVKYKIAAFFQNREDRNPQITIMHRDKKLRELSAVEFNASYHAIQKEKEIVNDLDKSNINQYIKIKNETNENKVKLLHLEKIKEQILDLRKELLTPQYQELLNALLDNLVLNKLKKIDLAILTSINLVNKLKEISQLYHTHLDMEVKPEDILKKVVEEANYIRLIDKEQSGVVSKTMELLKDAFPHLNKFKGKKCIFFRGKTGAGKSAAVCYFLGANVEIFLNQVGARVVQIKKDVLSPINYPKIGQSLGESETLYTQCYEIPQQIPNVDPEIALVDCAGDDDTRGDDHILCTNLSTDEAVKLSASIQANVITLPIHDFISGSGRMGALLDLVDKIQERFPHTFNPDQPQYNSHLYFLITKDMQAAPEQVAKVKDGTLINELVKETDAKLQALTLKHQEGEDNEFELSMAQRKLNIWKSIQQMHSRNQIDVANLRDGIKRKELLQKYSNASAPFNKKEYLPAMQGEEMQMKFGKYVEMSTHTWTHRVFEQYLFALPSSIEESKVKISNHRQSIKDVDAEIDKKNMTIAQLEESLKDVKLLIKELREAKNDPSKLRASHRDDLENQVKNTRTARFTKIQKEKDEIENSIVEKEKTLKKLNAAIKKQADELKAKETAIEELNEEVVNLSTGEQIEVLYERSYKANEIFNVRHYRGGRKERFEEMRSLKPEEIVNTTEENASTYNDTVGLDPIIERKYRLCPTDEKLRKQFNEFKNVTENFEDGKYSGKYEAKVEGNRFEPALGCKVSPDGKKIIYSFNLTFEKGKTLPWIKISHKIPNINVNEATIINKVAEITALKKEVANLQVELDGGNRVRGKKTERTELESDIKNLRKESKEKNNEITEFQKNLTRQKLEEMLQEQENEATKIQQDLNKLSSSKHLEKKKEDLQQETKQEEEHLEKIHKSKRNLAMIIYSQQGTAILLRKFAQIATQKNNSDTFGKKRTAMIASCQEFMNTFDKNIKEIMKGVCLELQVNPVNIEEFIMASKEIEEENNSSQQKTSNKKTSLEITDNPPENPPPLETSARTKRKIQEPLITPSSSTPRQTRANSKRKSIAETNEPIIIDKPLPQPKSSSSGKRSKQATPLQDDSERTLRNGKKRGSSNSVDEEKSASIIRDKRKNLQKK